MISTSTLLVSALETALFDSPKHGQVSDSMRSIDGSAVWRIIPKLRKVSRADIVRISDLIGLKVREITENSSGFSVIVDLTGV